MAQKSKVAAIPFQPIARTALPITPLPMPPGTGVETTVEMPAAVDLTEKKKAWFLIGRGRIGKTTFARWLVETMGQRGGSAIDVSVGGTRRPEQDCSRQQPQVTQTAVRLPQVHV